MRRKDLKSVEINPSDLPSELNEALEEFVQHLIDQEEEQEKIELGTVNDLTRQAYAKVMDELEDLREEFELKKKLLERKVRRELKAEFEHRFDDLDARHTKMWEVIEEEVGVPPNQNLTLTINRKTGTVTNLVKIRHDKQTH